MSKILFRFLSVIIISTMVSEYSEVEGQTYRILPLGNSLTQGWGSLPLDMRVSYRLRLRDTLLLSGHNIDYIGHQVSGSSLLPLDPEHCGIPDTRDQYVLRLLQDGWDIRNGIQTTPGNEPYLDLYPADIILLHIGTNDILNGEGHSAGTVSQILDEIDAWEVANNYPVTVFVARILNTVPYNSNITAFNDSVSLMIAARADTSIIMVDMESGAGIVYGPVPGDFEGDGIHLLQTGYDKMGEAWFAAIDTFVNGTTAPVAPTGLSAVASGTSSINLNWSDHSGDETGFRIERSTTSGDGFIPITTVAANSTSYTDNTLVDGTTYYYRVLAANGLVYSTYSNQASATTALAAPTGLSATASGTSSIVLGWTDVSVSETGYTVERSTTSGSGFTQIASVAANTTGYTDNTPVDGTTYYYRVRAVRVSVYSAYSNQASATTTLAAPTALSATASGTSSIILSWTDVSVSETGYQIERSITSGSGFSLIASVAANSTGYTDNSVQDGTTYYYRVRAAKAPLYSAYSNQASATTILAAPTGLSATASGTSSIVLSWSDVAASETGYLIERSVTSGSGFAQIASVAANSMGYTDNTAVDGTTYYYRVRAVRVSVYSAYSNQASATTILAAPTGLSATASGTSSIVLSWTDVSVSETGYQVERSNTSGSGFTQIASVAANSAGYTDNSAVDGTTYYYRVRAAKAAVYSAYSNEANATTGLAAPTGLSATASGTSSIVLSWTDVSVSETGYRVERSTTSGSGFIQIASIGANLEDYTDNTVMEGITYYYRVRAAKAAVYSSYSNEASATTTLATPTGLSVTASGTSSIVLNWTDVSSGETGYQIERSITSGSGFTQIASISPNSESYTDNTPLDGTTYYYRVRATKAAIYSAYSNEASATTLLAAPTGLSATPSGSSSIVLSWTDVSVSETGYQVERSITSGSGFTQIASVAANSTGYTDNTAGEGTTYYYRVRAAKAPLYSVYSNQASATISLAAPTGLSATASGPSSIVLSWTDVSASETGYQIERSITSGSGFSLIASVAANSDSYTDNTVLDGTTYYYRVRAAKAAVYSAYSNQASATTTLAAPTGLSATAAGTSSIVLSWTDVSVSETSYQIERSISSGSGFSLIASVAANSAGYTDNTALDGTTYYYRVRAVRAAVYSAYSNEASATTTLAAPTGLSATASGATAIVLSWTDVSVSETGYQIERSITSGSGFAQIATVAANSAGYTDNSALDGTTYYYRVRAARVSVYSAYSNQAGATTLLAVPTGLSATASGTSSIVLSWTDVSVSETGYRVERSITSGSGFTQIASIAANTAGYTDNSVLDGTTYYYRVRAARVSVYSAYSNQASATTTLAAPTGLSATASGISSIVLNWTDVSASETGYVIEHSTTSGSGFTPVHTTAANATTYTDIGLVDNTVYYYRVRATNGVIYSEYSNEASDTTDLAVPVAPDRLNGSATNTCSVALTWRDRSNNEDGFEIERSLLPTSGFVLLQTVAKNIESYTDTTTHNNTSYYYRVRAFNAGGKSAYATTIRVTVSITLNGGLIGINETLCPGGDPSLIINLNSPAGGSNNWEYQWQSRITPGLFANIPDATGLTFDPPEGIMETTEYQRVSTVECGSVQSNVVIKNVEDLVDPQFTYCPNDTIIRIERNETSIEITPPAPVITDNCLLFLATWTLSGAITGSSPDTGINILGVVDFPLGTTTVTYYAEDFMGNNSDCSFDVAVRIKDPEIREVTIPDDTMKIGDIVPVTIKVSRDGGTVYTLVSGRIGGYLLKNLKRTNDTIYHANFEIVEGGNSYLAEVDIPVSNLVVAAGAVRSLPYNTPISQDHDLLDAKLPVITYVNAVPGLYKIDDEVILNIRADGNDYKIDDLSTINGILVTEPNIDFSELGLGFYRLSYMVEEGDTDVDFGELTASVILIKPSGNTGKPFTVIGDIDKVAIDAHAPVITRMEAPSIEVGLAGTVQVAITADGEGYVAGPGTVINRIPLSSPNVSFSEVAGGLYELSYVVGEGDSDVAPGELEMSLVIIDSAGNISEPYDLLESNTLEVYTDPPTALLAGSPEVCEDETTDLVVLLTGRPPWSIDLSDGTTTNTYEGIVTNEYQIPVTPEQTTNYRITLVTDVNGVINTDGGSFRVEVAPKTDVEIINLAGGYSVDADPVELEASLPGGVFSGPGVFNNPDIFDPGIADTVNSPHTIYYTYVNSNGCVSIDSTLVFVLGGEGDIYIPRNIVCNYMPPFLASASNIAGVTGSFRLLNSNGQQVPGLTDHGNNSATIDPSLLAKGNYTIEYEYFAGVLLYLRTTFLVEVAQVPVITSPTKLTYCQNDSPVQLVSTVTGAIFTGPGVSGNVTDGFIFDPGEGLIGANVITCKVTTSNGCSKSTQISLTVHSSPAVLFTLHTVCLDQEGGNVTFSNLTENKLSIETWSWDFGDPASGADNHSGLVEPEHFYETSGEKSISLTATTSEGCSSEYVLDTTLGFIPVADFDWMTDCYRSGTETLFLNRSSSGSADPELLRWTFMTSDGSVMDEIETSSPEDTVRFQFDAANDYRVRLFIGNKHGCSDTTTKELILRSTIQLSDTEYLEDFNGDVSEWTIGSYGPAASWTWGEPDFSGFEPVQGDKAWFTQFPEGQVVYNEHSWIQSPCFDFTGMKRPLIKLDLMRSFIPDVNGAVLQYRDESGKGWKTLGHIGSGIEWYNVANLVNNPGGSSFGWGLGESDNPDSEWVTAIHDLGELKGNPHASFRLVMATSEAQGTGNQGFAFDNIVISEKTKLAVLEHFTNSSDFESKSADDVVDDLVLGNRQEVIDLQYHTGYPGFDPMNQNNPLPASNRAGNLGVGQQAPYAVLEGGFNEQLHYDFSDSNHIPDQDALKLLSLGIPYFNVDLEVDWSEGDMVATTTVTCKNVNYPEYIQLYVVVFESLVTAYTGGNGDVEFRNVVLEMLPSVTGKLLGNNWKPGKSVTQTDNWIFESYVEDVADLGVVAFVQDRNTREILQAAVNYKTPLTTVPDRNTGVSELKVYPNPAKDQLYVNLGNRAEELGFLEMYDLNGRILMKMEIHPGFQILHLDIQDLTRGMYVIQRIESGKLVSRSKFVKTE